ncbi:MAG: hypothetical protein ACFFCO_05975 [Promethearchaeota archaeon]
MVCLFGGYLDNLLVTSIIWVLLITLTLYLIVWGISWLNSAAFPGAGDRFRGRSGRKFFDMYHGGWPARAFIRHPRAFKTGLFCISTGIGMASLLIMLWSQIPHLELYFGFQAVLEISQVAFMSLLISGLCLLPIGILLIRGRGPKAPQPDRAPSRLTGRLLEGT